MAQTKKYAVVDSAKYTQKTIRGRIEAAFLEHLGEVLTNDDLKSVARDPATGVEPENWHQRLSELRTDDGYTILTNRDRSDLRIGEYLMPTADKRQQRNTRVRPTPSAWKAVLERAGTRCEWNEDGEMCGLAEGETDPVGGGTVHLTPDHKRPHQYGVRIDPNDPDAWQALCGRHQVMKKNYWDDATGNINVLAIVQAATRSVKLKVYKFLKEYFGDM